jgi:hypothetical protein
MKKRIEALTRIGRQQSLMHELGRLRLTAIQREQAGLSEDLGAVFEALSSGNLAYGASAALSACYIRALQSRLDLLAHESDNARRKAQAHGIRAKLAGQAAELAARNHRDEKERKELADLVERAIARRSASPT